MTTSAESDNHHSKEDPGMEVNNLSQGIKEVQSALDFIENAPMHKFANGMENLKSAINKNVASLEAATGVFKQVSSECDMIKVQLDTVTTENRELGQRLASWQNRLKEQEEESRKKEENVSQLLMQEQQKLKDKEVTLRQLRESKEAMEEGARTNVQMLVDKIKEKQRQMDEKEASLEQLRKEKEADELGMKAMLDELNGELGEKQRLLGEKDESLEQLRKEKEADELGMKAMLDELNGELREQQRLLGEKDESLEQFRKDKEANELGMKTMLDELNGELREQQRLLGEKNESLQQLQNEKQETDIQLQTIQEQLDAMKQEGTAYEQLTDQSEQELIELKNQNDRLTLKAAQFEAEIETLSKSLEDLEYKHKEMSESLRSTSREKERLEEEKEKLSAQVEESERELTALKGDLEALGKDEEGIAAELSLVNGKLREREDEFEKTLKENNYLARQREELLAREKELQAREKELEVENTREMKKIESLTNENEKFTTMLAERDEAIAHLSSDTEEKAMLDKKTDSIGSVIKGIREKLSREKEEIVKRKEEKERTLLKEREEKLVALNEEAEHENKILEEFFERDVNVVIGPIKEARMKRDKIEEDLASMTQEFKEKYGDYLEKDLVSVANKQREAEEELEAKLHGLIRQLPEELQKDLSKERILEGNLETIFKEEKLKIQERLLTGEQECEKGCDLKKYDLYQKYLKELGEVIEEAMKEKTLQINALPEDKRLVTLAFHELEESLRESEKIRRKSALELKKKMDEKKMNILERKITNSIQERDVEKSRTQELEKELKALKISKADTRIELRKLRAAGEEGKVKIESEFREKLEKELRGRLEIEYQDRFAAEVKKLDERPISKQKATRKTVKKPINEKKYPFVHCPSCDRRIEIRSTERPIEITCPGCENDLYIRDKVTDQANPGKDGTPVRSSSERSPDHGSSTAQSTGEVGDDGRSSASVTTSGSRRRISEDLISTLVDPSSDYSAPSTNRTREITCPFCGKKHNVPSDLTKRLTCTCGRRIRTE